MFTQRQPVWLWIDPTRRCNLACELCYTKPSHAGDDLRPEDLEIFLERITEDPAVVPQELTFNWRGEPLMNKRFCELLRVLDRSRLTCPVQFHTNAMLLTPRKAASIVDSAGPLRIFVSIDGGNARRHDENRGQDSFRRAIRGAWNLLAARGELENPRIILYQLDLGEPLDQYDPEFVALSRAVDDYQRVQPVLPGAPEGEYRGGAELSPELSRSPLVPLRRIPRGPCFWAGNSISVAPDGDVSICILSNRSDGVIGNLHRDSIGALMGRAGEWRTRMTRDGRAAIQHCVGCHKCEGDARPRQPLTSDRALRRATPPAAEEG
jgi:MoaA/NifB/PqqE/SkfB family radical SAM enzyme